MLSNITLRTHIAVLLVLFLLFSVVAAVVGVMGFSSALADLQSIANKDAVWRAAMQSVEQRYSNALWITVICVVFAVIVAVTTYVVINNRLLNPLSYLRSHFNDIAKGDLSQRIVVKSKDEVGLVFESLRQMQDNLMKTFSTVRFGVGKINQDTDEIVSGNRRLGSRIEEQAAALQQTATSMEQLSSTVRQNADNAHQANQLAVTASNVAQRGGQAVGEVVSTMQGISASSSKIADIVGVIDSIAFQTNILALNAAVEAARAGEQGRGFAVVASEVRALAQRSAQAAREITALIDDSVSKVNEGSGQVERAGATMQEIVDSVKRVTDIMGEISAATIEQSGGIDQVNMAISSMDSSTRYNAERIEETAQAAADMNKQSHTLYNILTAYQLPESYVIDIDAQTRNQRAAVPQQHSGSLQSPTKAIPGKRVAPIKSTATQALGVAAIKKNPAEIPGMNVASGTGKDAKLLRPDLTGSKKSNSAEDDWVEF